MDVALIIPHLGNPVNPLVGDPLVAVNDWTTEVKVPRIVNAS